jgi:dUTP pyrophosphatase
MEIREDYSQEEIENLKQYLDNTDDDQDIDDADMQTFIQNMFGMSMEEYSGAIEDAMKSKTLGYKKVSPDAVDPKYNYEKDSGFDLHSIEDLTLPGLSRATLPGLSRAMVGTGLSFDIPDGYEIQIRPKSGLAINYGITVLNTPSTIDGGYTGEVKVILVNTSRETYEVKKGMKIAQAVLCPVQQGKYVNFENLDELPQTDRGDNGFGSTGLI